MMMLKRFISLKLAANLMIATLGALLLFHVLVLLGVVPADMVWGGRALTAVQLLLMEIGALLVTALMILMIAVRVGYYERPEWRGFAQTAMWVIFVFLILNTVGNLSSTNRLETLIFTPVTIILAVLTYRLAMREEK